MLFALALLAAGGAAGSTVPTPLFEPVVNRYVANRVPAKAVKLDASKICKQGFVDPSLLAVQMMIQLEMFDELAEKGVTAQLGNFQGDACDPGNLAKPDKGGAYKQNAYCTGAIVVQRLLLNVYPGFQPDRALGLNVTDDADLAPDVSKVRNGGDVAAFATAFLASKASDGYVRCDNVSPPKDDGPPKPPAEKTILAVAPAPLSPPSRPSKDIWASDSQYMSRSDIENPVASLGALLESAFKTVQWRSMSANLVYRDSSGSGDPTYLTGQDLYDADKGFSLSLSHTLAKPTATKPGGATYAPAVQGAVGIPTCHLLTTKKDCRWLPAGVNADDPSAANRGFSYNFIPYFGIDNEATKTVLSGAAKSDPATITARQTELGVTAFIHDDHSIIEGQSANQTNCLVQRLGLLNSENSACGSYFVARAYALTNDLDGSRLNGLALRYVPLLATDRKGIGRGDLCVNSVCGDPNRVLRFGLLFDLRADLGNFTNRGTKPELDDLNQNYVRLGYRAGTQAMLNVIPDLPVTLWAAYTDLRPTQGYGKDLGEFQAQASVSFDVTTLSFSWRNGRREDTAQRDSTWKLTLGFKPKSN